MGSQTSTSRHPPLVDLDDTQLSDVSSPAAAPPLPPGIRLHLDYIEEGDLLLHPSSSSFSNSSSRRHSRELRSGRAAGRPPGGFTEEQQQQLLPSRQQQQQQKDFLSVSENSSKEEKEKERVGGSRGMNAHEPAAAAAPAPAAAARPTAAAAPPAAAATPAAAAAPLLAAAAAPSAAAAAASPTAAAATTDIVVVTRGISSQHQGERDSSKDVQNASPQQETKEEEELIPCVFTWTHGGHSVYLTGSFNDWSLTNKIRLNRSGHDFSYIQNLPRGVHFYKFIVDDEWKFAPDQRTQSDQHGNVNNVLDISSFKGFDFALPSEIQQARSGQYHQSVPEPSEYSSDAPTIPILLGKSAHAYTDPPPLAGAGIPVHCLANHLFHDSHAPAVFGPHTSCVATTHRWRIPNSRSTSGQRYTTYIYVTVNPLYPFPSAAEDATAAAAEDVDSCAAEAAAAAAGVEAHTNPLANLLVYKRRDTAGRRRDERERRVRTQRRSPVKTS